MLSKNCPKSTIFMIFFSQVHPQQKVRKSQEGSGRCLLKILHKKEYIKEPCQQCLDFFYARLRGGRKGHSQNTILTL